MLVGAADTLAAGVAKRFRFGLLISCSLVSLVLQIWLARWVFHTKEIRDRELFLLPAPLLLPRGVPDSVLPDQSVLRELNDAFHDHAGVGYVVNTLPGAVVNLIEDDSAVPEDSDDSVDDTEDEDATLPWIVKMERKSPPLGGPKVMDPMPGAPAYDKSTEFELIWKYLMEEKFPPYVGNSEWMNRFPKHSRQWYNSHAVFPGYRNTGPDFRYHGIVGVYPNGTQAWRGSPMPEPIEKVDRKEAMKDGGFYKALADALPLDRIPDDTRDDICKPIKYNYGDGFAGEEGQEPLDEDVSVVITFYNEPLSTLLRSVHSVLNNTPPSLLREIILVDDHSSLEELVPNEEPDGTITGGDLYEYVKLLPKTKVLRLGERRGLVWARLAGAQSALAPVLVVLDSHIEVNEGWLEPQLLRLKQSPKSIVFPQIMALDADTFKYNGHAGIGCWLSWKWNMVEQASLTGTLTKPDPIASPSMAGGLFAVKLDWFWTIGGYDEEFSMWGSENVEMGFRTWMCGGRMECTPCARTYHIYRSGGSGYKSPSEMVWKNKVRTARIWMDEWYQIAEKFVGKESYLGNMDHMLELKERLQCKSFKWFMENVDPKHEAQKLEDVEVLGDISSVAFPGTCLDTLNHKSGEEFGVYGCHKQGGTQGVFKDRTRKIMRTFTDERTCYGINGTKPVLAECRANGEIWSIDWQTKQMKAQPDEKAPELCLAAVDKNTIHFEPCDPESVKQKWEITKFEIDPNFKLPDFSEEYKRLHQALAAVAD